MSFAAIRPVFPKISDTFLLRSGQGISPSGGCLSRIRPGRPLGSVTATTSHVPFRRTGRAYGPVARERRELP